MEGFSTAEPAMRNRYAASFIAMSDVTMSREAVRNIAATDVSARTVSRVSPETGAIVSASPERMSPAVVPGAGSDENAACEPLRSVVSVRRTSIRSIRIVTIRTNRRPGDISRADAYADSHRPDADADSNLRRRGGDRN